LHEREERLHLGERLGQLTRLHARLFWSSRSCHCAS
jgi:hypothetical protein